MTDATPRTYPQGVPSWIDHRSPDPDAAERFYAALFGWRLEERLPPHVPGSYRIASIDGREVGAVADGVDHAVWTTYLAVDDADVTAARVVELGGTAATPEDAGAGGRAGRSVDCVDPAGAAFGLWQARERLGAQHINAPGGWVFSDLRAADPERAIRFYRELFGWQVTDVGEDGAWIRLPGYGDHLAATSDPGIHERQDGAPEGFADVVAVLGRAPGAHDDWHVSFSVADREAAITRVIDLGGQVLGTWEGPWVRAAEVVDPLGATFRVTQFAPA